MSALRGWECRYVGEWFVWGGRWVCMCMEIGPVCVTPHCIQKYHWFTEFDRKKRVCVQDECFVRMGVQVCG